MNPTALDEVVDARAEVMEKGLKLAFRPGEMVPMKGIWFKVSEVGVDVLTLRPVSMTKNRAKEIKNADRI